MARGSPPARRRESIKQASAPSRSESFWVSTCAQLIKSRDPLCTFYNNYLFFEFWQRQVGRRDKTHSPSVVELLTQPLHRVYHHRSARRSPALLTRAREEPEDTIRGIILLPTTSIDAPAQFQEGGKFFQGTRVTTFFFSLG